MSTSAGGSSSLGVIPLLSVRVVFTVGGRVGVGVLVIGVDAELCDSYSCIGSVMYSYTLEGAPFAGTARVHNHPRTPRPPGNACQF